jgi:hypothetical protein
MSQGDTFCGYQGDALGVEGEPSLSSVHDALVFSIAEVLDAVLQSGAPHHDQLVRSLLAMWDGPRPEPKLKTASHNVFISLNYDILIDNALERQAITPAYGVPPECYATQPDDPCLPEEEGPFQACLSPGLYKLHGSLNWLYCPVCRRLTVTPREKSVCRLVTSPASCRCTGCSSGTVPIIVPPTYYKVLSNPYLAQQWLLAEKALRQADQVVFCGYSMPDADVHIRYLLKRVELSRQTPLQVYVVNEHDGKTCDQRQAEMARYTRFLRSRKDLHFTALGFEAFSQNPTLIWDESQWLQNPVREDNNT